MSESNRSRKRHGQARIEYRANRKEIEERVAAGYSNIMIYEELAAIGKLTVSYSAFCDYIRGEGQRIHSRRRKSASGRMQKSGSNTFKPAAKSEPFFIDRSKTLEDLC
jgi:hypothetical protein